MPPFGSDSRVIEQSRASPVVTPPRRSRPDGHVDPADGVSHGYAVVADHGLRDTTLPHSHRDGDGFGSTLHRPVQQPEEGCRGDERDPESGRRGLREDEEDDTDEEE